MAMIDYPQIMDRQIGRQVAHWTMAASRLSNLDDLASPQAWQELEDYLGLVLRENLTEAVSAIQHQARTLQDQLHLASTVEDMKAVARNMFRFRKSYLRTETLLDFYADAINTRTNPAISSLLRACDMLSRRSMADLLNPLERQTPPVLTYIDKGVGASILKAGLRLWDGTTESSVAAIKIVRHNVYRPTSLIHEAGHQVAHILGWNEELAASLREGLAQHSHEIADLWSSWASEVAADAFAFAHTGYAAVAGLHDVVASGSSYVFRYIPVDPHPISYIRVLLGTTLCQRFYGTGPWENLALFLQRSYPLSAASSTVQSLLKGSIPILPYVAEIVLLKPMRAFRGRSLADIINPERASPRRLFELEKKAGPALYTSSHWISNEAVRLLGLTGFRAATEPDSALEVLQQQREWMAILGSLRAARAI